VPARTVGRITRRAAFAEFPRARARGASGPVRVTFVPAPAGDTGAFPQVGYAIGRQCGGAVVRNSLRRRTRAVVHEVAPSLPSGTYLVRLEASAATQLPAAFRGNVAEALQKAVAARGRV
jgi:ribonuclease P protein component